MHGLEVGNMVFTQFKYDHQGNTSEIPIRIIDTGQGLERIPWLMNGTPTSYYDVFPTAFDYLQDKINVPLNTDVWNKMMRKACLLNVDEV